MDSFNEKRVSDPVHGTIGLSKIELEIIGCPVFQRLRGIKQLGLAHLVFPGADYSRFSHSLGVCHVAGRILDAIHRNGLAPAGDLDEKTIQLYRLAALLHDVGHYPFSHAMEDALKNYFAVQKIQPQSCPGTGKDEVYYGHERVGKEILTQDSNVSEILKRGGFDSKVIASVILREEPPTFTNLISSDLDADRIDYLLRTAHHTGLPYGSVDLEYLLTQMRVDKEKRICVTAKALRAAEHFLLCRYFDYQQVAYHKTVAGFEWLLKDSLQFLVKNGRIKCSAGKVEKMLQTGEWRDFDDARVIRLMREALDESKMAEGKQGEPGWEKMRAILERNPPRLAACFQCFAAGDSINDHRTRQLRVKERIQKWANHFGISTDQWHVWAQDGSALTKIGPHIPISQINSTTASQEDRVHQAIRILDARTNTSRPIMETGQSLMKILSQYALYEIRVYVLLPKGQGENVVKIREHIHEDLPDIQWI